MPLSLNFILALNASLRDKLRTSLFFTLLEHLSQLMIQCSFFFLLQKLKHIDNSQLKVTCTHRCGCLEKKLVTTKEIWLKD